AGELDDDLGHEGHAPFVGSVFLRDGDLHPGPQSDGDGWARSAHGSVRSGCTQRIAKNLRGAAGDTRRSTRRRPPEQSRVAPMLGGMSVEVGSAVLEALHHPLPGLRLLTDAADTEAYRWDETEYMHPGMPLGVAFPASTWEVSRVVRLAAEHRVPLVPRGAASGLSGGAIAVEGALTMAMTGMAHILEIDEANLVAVIQPGVINAELGRAVAEHGLL